MRTMVKAAEHLEEVEINRLLKYLYQKKMEILVV